jgi:SpoVK/Ycf46/Vps4 family AAA+-type ATPase
MNYSIARGPLDNQYSYIFPEQLFQEKYSQYPIEYFAAGFAYYDLAALDVKIKEAFGEPSNMMNHYRHVFQDNATKLDERAYFFENCLVCIKNKIFANCYDEEGDQKTDEEEVREKIKIDILSNGKIENIKEKFESLLSKNFEEKRKSSELSILCFNNMEGFYLKNVKTINKVEIDYDAHYNAGFKEVSDHIISKLNSKNEKGIVLLHGAPGTGKTSYLRQLTKDIKDKDIIFIPPDFAANISNPDFVAFFLDYANSILIIEDAENILKSRKSGGNQTVANLLNLSDGLLGDGLKLQIVCTFNAPITDIDEALLREGRLIAEYKFDKLTKEKSQNLISKIYASEEIPKIDKEMSLAEIFNHKEKRFITKKDGAIGFRR